MACKHTNNGRYGFVLDQSAFGSTRKLELRDALPSEYLWRIGLQNVVFGDSIRIEAIVANPYGSPMIQTSQPWLIGPAPEMDDIREFMEDQGFLRLPKQMLELGVLPMLSWYRPADGVLVFDTKTSNFVRLGDIVSPIDLRMAIYPQGLLEETACLNGVDRQAMADAPNKE